MITTCLDILTGRRIPLDPPVPETVEEALIVLRNRLARDRETPFEQIVMACWSGVPADVVRAADALRIARARVIHDRRDLRPNLDLPRSTLSTIVLTALQALAEGEYEADLDRLAAARMARSHQDDGR